MWDKTHDSLKPFTQKDPALVSELLATKNFFLFSELE